MLQSTRTWKDNRGFAPPGERAARTRRVLYLQALSGSDKFGSMEEQALILAQRAQDRGGLLLPAFVTPLADEFQALCAPEGLRVATLNLWRFRLSTFRQLVRLIREERIDLVHWNFYLVFRNSYFWALKARLPRLMHIWTNHTSVANELIGEKDGAINRALFRCYDRIVGVSDFLRDDMQSRWHLEGVGRFHHFVNTERFRPDLQTRARVRAELGVGEAFVAVVVASLITYKGVDVAIRAMARTSPDARLWIVGNGPERESLEALADQLGVGSRVRFLGLQRCVEPYMQAADVLICPSIWWEAAGLSNIEAMACGLPVLASRSGGIPEFVTDGETGFLFPIGDHQALARLLERLRVETDLRRDLGARARAAAVSRFSPAGNVDRDLALYEM